MVEGIPWIYYCDIFWIYHNSIPYSVVPTQARSGDPGQGGAVSVGPIWHARIAIRPAKHRCSDVKVSKKFG